MDSETTQEEWEILFSQFKQSLSLASESNNFTITQNLFSDLIDKIENYEPTIQKEIEQKIIILLLKTPNALKTTLNTAIGSRNFLRLCFHFKNLPATIIVPIFASLLNNLTPKQLELSFVILSLNRPLNPIKDIGYYQEYVSDSVLMEMLSTLTSLFVILGKESRKNLLATLHLYIKSKDEALAEKCQLLELKHQKIEINHKLGTISNVLSSFQYSYPSQLDSTFKTLVQGKDIPKIVANLYLSFFIEHITAAFKNHETALMIAQIKNDADTAQIKTTLTIDFTPQDIIHYLYNQYLLTQHTEPLKLTEFYIKRAINKLDEKSFNYYYRSHFDMWHTLDNENEGFDNKQMRILRWLYKVEKISLVSFQMCVFSCEAALEQRKIEPIDKIMLARDAIKTLTIEGLDYAWTAIHTNSSQSSYSLSNLTIDGQFLEGHNIQAPFFGLSGKRIGRLLKRANYQPFYKEFLLMAIATTSGEKTILEQSLHLKKIEGFQQYYIQNFLKQASPENLNWLYFLMISGIKVDAKKVFSITPSIILEKPAGILGANFDNIIKVIFTQNNANLILKRELQNLMNSDSCYFLDTIAFTLIKEKITKLLPSAQILAQNYLSGTLNQVSRNVTILDTQKIPFENRMDFARIMRYASLNPERLEELLNKIPLASTPNQNIITPEVSHEVFFNTSNMLPIWSLVDIARTHNTLAWYLIKSYTLGTVQKGPLYNYLLTGIWRFKYVDETLDYMTDQDLAIFVLLAHHPVYLNDTLDILRPFFLDPNLSLDQQTYIEALNIQTVCTNKIANPFKRHLFLSALKTCKTLCVLDIEDSDAEELYPYIKSHPTLNSVIFNNSILNELQIIQYLGLDLSHLSVINPYTTEHRDDFELSDEFVNIIVSKIENTKKTLSFDLTQCTVSYAQADRIIQAIKKQELIASVSFKDTNYSLDVIDNIHKDCYTSNVKFWFYCINKIKVINFHGNLLAHLKDVIQTPYLTSSFIINNVKLLSDYDLGYLIQSLESKNFSNIDHQGKKMLQHPILISFILICLKYPELTQTLYNELIKMRMLLPPIASVENINDSTNTTDQIKLAPITSLELTTLPFTSTIIPFIPDCFKNAQTLTSIKFESMDVYNLATLALKHFPNLHELKLVNTFLPLNELEECFKIIPRVPSLRSFQFGEDPKAQKHYITIPEPTIKLISEMILHPQTRLDMLVLSELLFTVNELAMLICAFHTNPNVLQMVLSVSLKSSHELNWLLQLPSRFPCEAHIIYNQNQTPVAMTFIKPMPVPVLTFSQESSNDLIATNTENINNEKEKVLTGRVDAMNVVSSTENQTLEDQIDLNKTSIDVLTTELPLEKLPAAFIFAQKPRWIDAKASKPSKEESKKDKEPSP